MDTTTHSQTRILTANCTVDNEEHDLFWCAAHAIGLTQTVHEQAQVAGNFFTVNQVTQNGEPVDPGKLSDQQVLAAFNVFNDEWRRMMNQGLTPGAALAAITPIMTQWGWSGSKPYREAVSQLNETNTPQGTADHQELNGRVSTRDEAKRRSRKPVATFFARSKVRGPTASAPITIRTSSTKRLREPKVQ